MKKLLVGVLAVSLLSLSAAATNGGGKKKDRKKAKTECKKDNTCDVKNCDPRNCPFPVCPPCPKDEKCQPKPGCSGN
jgi:hypothetical protein